MTNNSAHELPQEPSEMDLMKMAAELVRDSGIDVQTAIQIVKGFRKSPRRASAAAPSAVKAVNDILPSPKRPTPNAEDEMKRAIQTYFDALTLLHRELDKQRAIKGKKMKPHNGHLATRSDGGTFERRAVEAIAKGFDVANALNERREELLSWIDGTCRWNPDTSPGQIEKVNAAVAHLVRTPAAGVSDSSAHGKESA